MASGWPTGSVLLGRQCYPSLRNSWRCICTYYCWAACPGCWRALWVRMVLCASQKLGCWVQAQRLCWDRADKCCWTRAEPVQADIDVVNYMVCLAVSGFFPINQGILDNNWLNCYPVLLACPLSIACCLWAQDWVWYGITAWQPGAILEKKVSRLKTPLWM